MDITLSAIDVDGDILTFTAESDNEGVDVSIEGLVLTLTPADNYNGIANITVTVTDGEYTDSETFTLTVNEVNDVPVLTEIGSQYTDEDEDLTIELSASDIDVETNGQTLSYSASSSDESLVIVSTTTEDDGTAGTLTFDVQPDQNGTAIITVTVSDGELEDSEEFVLTVTPVNDTPVIDLPDSFTFIEDGDLTEDLSGYLSDIDEDELTLTVSGNENVDVSIDGFVVSFSALQDWNGTEVLTFTCLLYTSPSTRD